MVSEASVVSKQLVGEYFSASLFPPDVPGPLCGGDMASYFIFILNVSIYYH